MVNHFASLLSNLNLFVTEPSQYNYVLGDGEAGHNDVIFITSAGQSLTLSDTYTTTDAVKHRSIFIDRNYTPIPLPRELQSVYDILFPTEASVYYKQFLLYCYLRAVSSSDKSADIKIYDSRITYNLDEVSDYFRLARTASAKSSNPDFNLIVSGNLKMQADAASYSNTFIVKQLGASQQLTVFSITQSKYYKLGQAPSSNAANKEITITRATDSLNSTAPIVIGDTGLSCVITGPLGASPNLLPGANNLWIFNAETPFSFDLIQKVKELEYRSDLVESMLTFNQNSSSGTYTSMWYTHYNPVYRLAGLLLAYVDRVNSICQSAQT